MNKNFGLQKEITEKITKCRYVSHIISKVSNRNLQHISTVSLRSADIAVKRREVKSKGEKERYSHLTAEFQGIARRDKKAFLSDQCKEIEENNRMGKTRDLFKKIRDIKGTFHQRWV